MPKGQFERSSCQRDWIWTDPSEPAPPSLQSNSTGWRWSFRGASMWLAGNAQNSPVSSTCPKLRYQTLSDTLNETDSLVVVSFFFNSQKNNFILFPTFIPIITNLFINLLSQIIRLLSLVLCVFILQCTSSNCIKTVMEMCVFELVCVWMVTVRFYLLWVRTTEVNIRVRQQQHNF